MPRTPIRNLTSAEFPIIHGRLLYFDRGRNYGLSQLCGQRIQKARLEPYCEMIRDLAQPASEKDPLSFGIEWSRCRS
jgi:hypothetical protein